MRSGATIAQVEPEDVRDQVIDLLWDHRHWPGSSRDDYVRLWEWRYGGLSESVPLTWVARAGDGRLVAHLAVFPRRYRVEDAELRCALPGDVLVHRDWRASGIGTRMILLPRQLVREGRFDIALVVGNVLVHKLCTRLGYRDLTTFASYVDLRRSGPGLERRFGRAARVAGPVIDLAWKLRRRLRQRAGRRRAAGLTVERLDASRLPRLDRGHWRHPPGRLVGAEDEAYLARRFLQDPYARREIFGLLDAATRRLEAHVAVEYGAGRGVVCDCRVNAARLDEVTAIALVGDHLPAAICTYAVAARPGSLLAGELEAAGFVPRPLEPPDRRLHLTAFWNRAHSLAAPLERTAAWNLYLGAADA